MPAVGLAGDLGLRRRRRGALRHPQPDGDQRRGRPAPLCSLRIKRASSETFRGRNRLHAGQRLPPGDSFVIDGLAEGYDDVDAHLCDDGVHPRFLRYDVAVGPEVPAVWVAGQSAAVAPAREGGA